MTSERSPSAKLSFRATFRRLRRMKGTVSTELCFGSRVFFAIRSGDKADAQCGGDARGRHSLLSTRRARRRRAHRVPHVKRYKQDRSTSAMREDHHNLRIHRDRRHIAASQDVGGEGADAVTARSNLTPTCIFSRSHRSRVTSPGGPMRSRTAAATAAAYGVSYTDPGFTMNTAGS